MLSLKSGEKQWSTNVMKVINFYHGKPAEKRKINPPARCLDLMILHGNGLDPFRLG